MDIHWNLPAFEEIRRLPGVDNRLREEVGKVMGVVGGKDNGYDGGVEPGKSRSRGYVVTVTRQAVRDEAKNHTLLRAIGGGA